MPAACIYICAVLAANLTATLFVPVPLWPGSEMLVSVGTLIFGLTFTQRDHMHARGRPFVYKVILLSALLNLAVMLSFRFLWGAAAAAACAARDWPWLEQAARMLLDSGWRVFIASFLAIVIAESADTEVYHKYLDRSWMARVLRSNAVSIPVDSVVFNLIAFAGSPLFPVLLLAKVIVGEICSKYLVGFVYAWLYPQRWQPGGARARPTS
jgi:hypothetical protein